MATPPRNLRSPPREEPPRTAMGDDENGVEVALGAALGTVAGLALRLWV